MEYSNITFSQNNYTNLIAVDTNNDHYNFNPFCLFRYVVSQNASVILPLHYTIIILYAETHNRLLLESACKIAHQTELVNFITNNSIVISYTIVSEVNDSCELFLTVSPFLYHVYEVLAHDVQLLPCPIGFTLQNGVCDCDPLLPTDIDTCYIDQSAIRRPANTWLSYTQSGTSKYLISDLSNGLLFIIFIKCQFTSS